MKRNLLEKERSLISEGALMLGIEVSYLWERMRLAMFPLPEVKGSLPANS